MALQKAPTTFSLEDFLEKYQDSLIPNIKDADFDEDDWSNYMFETYGTELEFVKHFQEHGYDIHTLIDENDGNEMFVEAGFHFINRMGYFITHKD
jgi:hypothetical protein